MHSSLNAPVFQTADGERSATWLELFFDLVFVVAVAALVALFEHHFTPAGLGMLLLFFFPLWWLWMEFSYFSDLFDDNSIFYQSMMILAMGGILKIALVLRLYGWEEGQTEFIACYLYLLGIHFVSYLRAWILGKRLRWFTQRYLGCAALAAACWAASLFVEGTPRYALWIIGTLVQMSASPSIYLLRDDYPVQLSHMPERFGLFSIIVLGEGIVAVTGGAMEREPSFGVLVAEISAFLLIVCLWKLYFYEASKDSVTDALRKTGRGSIARSFVYGYGHFFLYVAIVMVAVAVLTLLHETFDVHHAAHPAFARTILHGGATLFLAAITLIHWAAPESLFPRIVAARIACAVVSFLLWFFPLPAPVELVAQVLVCGGLILFEYLTYRSRGVLPGAEAGRITE